MNQLDQVVGKYTEGQIGVELRCTADVIYEQHNEHRRFVRSLMD